MALGGVFPVLDTVESNLLIRKAGVDDVGIVTSLIDEFAKGHPAEQHTRSIDTMRTAFFGDPSMGNFLLAEKKGNAIGFAGWRKVYDMFWAMHGGETIGLFVRPTYRGHGVAISLLAALCAEIRKQGGQYLVGTYDEGVAKLYERVAIGRPQRECHLSARAFEVVADLAGKTPRAIVRGLPDKELNFESE